MSSLSRSKYNEDMNKLEGITAIAIMVGLVMVAVLFFLGIVTNGWRQERAVDRQQQVIAEAGLDERLPLVGLDSVPGITVSGQLGGNFLSISGQLEGSNHSTASFAWVAQTGEIILTEVTYSKVRIFFTEGDPAVAFGFQYERMISNYETSDPDKGKEVLDPQNLNDFMMYLDQVTFYLSEEEYEKFMPSEVS